MQAPSQSAIDRSTPSRALRAAVGLLWIAVAALAAGPSRATELRLLLGDDAAAHGAFVEQLRHLAPLPPRAGVAVTLAVGPEAARLALRQPGHAPLLLAMLSRAEFERLKQALAQQHPQRPVAVLLREPAPAVQLALIAAVLPRKRRLGVLATTEASPLLHELQDAAHGWMLQVEYAPEPRSLGPALRRLVARSDALLVLPDLIGDSQAACLAVLRAGAGAELPVFGVSQGLVQSGALAAAYAGAQQLAEQAKTLAERLAGAPEAGAAGGAALIVESAAPALVRINPSVARGLSLALPDEQELAQRVTAVR